MSFSSPSPLLLPDDNRRALRQVVRGCRKAALATLMAGPGEGEAAPYVSLVTVATDHDLSPILLLSGLADHTRNLDADARVSLLFDRTDGHANPQSGPRVTVSGRARRCADRRLADRFLALHPAAAQYAGFGDFSVWRVEATRAHFVGGFGRAVWFDAPFGLAPEATMALAAAEPAVLAEYDGSVWEGGEARVAAFDADGCDLVLGDGIVRVAFAEPMRDVGEARAALAAALARVGLACGVPPTF